MIEIKGVSKTFVQRLDGNYQALDNITLTIDARRSKAREVRKEACFDPNLGWKQASFSIIQGAELNLQKI
ncbi:hypothetical protein SAMN04487897_102693 [Paenibacillus sp. yr247]|uniref:hypothetical protein n=1 Tax=Paenibacillus sp. yr247 TaxID=1761880 RepID=UPI00088E394C|nr:hypothetical protein [Paenibacillus sp. yr247]SDN37679.1 hypothetical protein SAMN04487897_102693 [Paenibacillus sp. yr247]